MIEQSVMEIAEGLKMLVGDGSRVVVQIDVYGNCVVGKGDRCSRKMGAFNFGLWIMHAVNMRRKKFYDDRYAKIRETLDLLKKITLPSDPKKRVTIARQADFYKAAMAESERIKQEVYERQRVPDSRYENEAKMVEGLFAKDLPVIKITRPTEYAQVDVAATKKLYTEGERAGYAEAGATTNRELVQRRDALIEEINRLKLSDQRWREEAQKLRVELALAKDILSKTALKMERQSRGHPIRGKATDFMVDDDIEFRVQPPIQHRDFVMEHMNVPFRMPGRFLDLMPSKLRTGLRVRTVKVDGRPSRNWKRWAKQERKFGVDGTVVEINRDHSGNSPDFVVVEHDCGGLGYYHLWEIEII